MALKKEKNMYLCQSFNQNMLMENIPFKEDLMDKKNKNNIAKILLAFGVLASPMMLANQVSADNSIANTTNTNNVDATATAQSDAVTTENVIKENKENEEQAKEVVNSAAEKAATEATKEATTTENTATDETVANSQTEEKSDENTKVVENKEEVDFKLDASQRHELKEAGYTDEEIQSIENSIKKSLTEDSKFNVYDFVASKVNAKKAENRSRQLEDESEPARRCCFGKRNQ